MGSLGAHIERRCSRARAADVTIRDVTIKNPDKKWDVNDVIPGSAEDLGDLKKSS